MSQGHAEEQVTQLQNEWFQAWINHDETTLNRLVADDYILITAGEGIQVSKKEWIRGAVGRFAQKGYQYDEMSVRVYENAAVVIWRYTEEVTDDLIERLYGQRPVHSRGDDGEPGSIQMFMTDVWIKREGGWQVVSRHASLPARAER